jgi:molybdopterin-containing oxidoreductase family iron-sulfur binding subunit
VVEKCTFCVQRINAGKDQAAAENRPLKDGEIQPACVQSCPTSALVFGDLNDPESQVSRLSRSSRGSKLLKDVGTLPKVTYLARQT